MKKELLKGIEKKLYALREEFLEELRTKNVEAAAIVDEGVPDIADQGLTDNIKELLHLLGEAKREEILKIDEALDQIRAGTYGRCLGCGNEIEAGRLQIRPQTRHCVSCKAEIERKETIKSGPGAGTY